MKKVLVCMAVIMAFMAGFIASDFTDKSVSDLVAPEAKAATGKVWQYNCADLNMRPKKINETLKSWGKNGWEMITMTPVGTFNAVVCFKK